MILYLGFELWASGLLNFYMTDVLCMLIRVGIRVSLVGAGLLNTMPKRKKI